MKIDTNLPPVPRPETPPPRPSFAAYVWRGDKFDDIGTGETRGDGHLIRLHLGADRADVIELRPADPAFYPGQRQQEPQPTFLAFVAGTEERAGTAWPHADGKGHRLKLRHSLPDGAEIELRPTEFYGTADDNRTPIRRRTARPRPRINA